MGANCTDPNIILDVLKAYKSKTSKTLLVYPNSGEVYDGKTKEWSNPAATKA